MRFLNVRTIWILSFAVVIGNAVEPQPALADWSSWEHLATATNSSGAKIVLEWRTYFFTGGDAFTSRNTKAQWRVKNETNRTLYDVSIDNKTYVCSNEKEISRSGESVTSTLSPSETDSTMPDNLDREKCPRITGVHFDDLDTIIEFQIERNGRTYNWGEFGNVEGD